MEEKFREALNFCIVEWDKDPAGMQINEYIGLTAKEFNDLTQTGEWPENVPLMRKGLLFMLQPAWVRGEVPVWFDHLYKDVDGKEIAYIRGSAEFIKLLVGELSWREFAYTNTDGAYLKQKESNVI